MGKSLDNANNSTAATKAEQQAGTSTNAVVTSAQQQNHDGSAKAWVNFTGSTGAVLSSYNCSVGRSGTGQYTLTFPTPFATANYVLVVTPELTGSVGTEAFLPLVRTGTRTTSTVNIVFVNTAVSAGVDPVVGHVVVYGRQ